MMKPSEALRQAMRADPRSLNQLARDSGVNVATLCRFVNGKQKLSQTSSDTMAALLGLELRPTKPARAKKRTTKPKGR